MGDRYYVITGADVTIVGDEQLDDVDVCLAAGMVDRVPAVLHGQMG